MIGADLDPRIENNPLLDRGVKTDLLHLPFEDNCFDIVFSRYVLEHVDAVQAFLKELHRILKTGGSFVFLAPNKWHYVAFMLTNIVAFLCGTVYERVVNRFDCLSGIRVNIVGCFRKTSPSTSD